MPQLKVDLVVDDKGSLVITGFGNKVDKVMWSAKGSVKALGSELAIAGAGFAAMFATGGVLLKQVTDVTDRYAMMESQLGLVTTGAENLAQVQRELYELSLGTHGAYGDTVTMYTRFARATEDAGVSQQDLLTITRAVNQAIIVSGASSTEATAAIIQLSQGLGSGVLRGEELNSVLEQTPRLAKMIADGMGITIGQLRQYGKDGKLTSEAVVNALKDQATVVDGEFKKMKTTVGQTMTDLRTVFESIIADGGESASVTETLTGYIEDFTTYLDDHREEVAGFFSSTMEGAKAVGDEVARLGKDGKPYLVGIGQALSGIYGTMKKMESIGGPSIGEWGLVGYALLRGGPQAGALALALVTINNKMEEFGIGARDILNDFNGKNLSGSDTWLERINQAATRTTGGLKLLGVNVDGLKFVIDQFNKGDGESHAFDSAVAAADDAAKNIKGAATDVGATWLDEWKKMERAAAESAAGQEKAQGEAVKAMRKQYDDYAKKVMELQRKIAGSEQDLASELRAMARTGMSDLGAWKDRKQEADAYYEAARRAAEANNFDMAQDMAKRAKEAYADLNEEVKVSITEMIRLKQEQAKKIRDSGWSKGTYQEYLNLLEQIKQLQGELAEEGSEAQKTVVSGSDALKTSMAGVQKAGQLELDIMKKQQKEAAALANELNKQSPTKFGAVTIDESTEAAVRFQEQTKELTKHWETMWETVGKDGKKVLTEIAGDIRALDGSTITIYTKHEELKSAGGLAGHYARGGVASYPRLASRYITAGGGFEDDVPAMLKKFEFVMRPEAVRHYGVGFMHRVNNREFDEKVTRASTGGLIGNLGRLVQRSAIPQRLSSGGQVEGNASVNEAITVQFQFPGSQVQPRGVFGRADAQALLRELKRMERLSSS